MKFGIPLLGIALAALFILSGCAAQANRLPEPRAVSDDSIASGRRLLASYGCGSCHSIPGVPGATAAVGPPLDRFYERSYIAGQFPNTWENLIGWIQSPQEMKPGTAMPDLGVKENEAIDMAAYLYHQAAMSEAGR